MLESPQGPWTNVFQQTAPVVPSIPSDKSLFWHSKAVKVVRYTFNWTQKRCLECVDPISWAARLQCWCLLLGWTWQLISKLCRSLQGSANPSLPVSDMRYHPSLHVQRLHKNAQERVERGTWRASNSAHELKSETTMLMLFAVVFNMAFNRGSMCLCPALAKAQRPLDQQVVPESARVRQSISSCQCHEISPISALSKAAQECTRKSWKRYLESIKFCPWTEEWDYNADVVCCCLEHGIQSWKHVSVPCSRESSTPAWSASCAGVCKGPPIHLFLSVTWDITHRCTFKGCTRMHKKELKEVLEEHQIRPMNWRVRLQCWCCLLLSSTWHSIVEARVCALLSRKLNAWLISKFCVCKGPPIKLCTAWHFCQKRTCDMRIFLAVAPLSSNFSFTGQKHVVSAGTAVAGGPSQTTIGWPFDSCRVRLQQQFVDGSSSIVLTPYCSQLNRMLTELQQNPRVIRDLISTPDRVCSKFETPDQSFSDRWLVCLSLIFQVIWSWRQDLQLMCKKLRRQGPVNWFCGTADCKNIVPLKRKKKNKKKKVPQKTHAQSQSSTNVKECAVSQKIRLHACLHNQTSTHYRKKLHKINQKLVIQKLLGCEQVTTSRQDHQNWWAPGAALVQWCHVHQGVRKKRPMAARPLKLCRLKHGMTSPIFKPTFKELCVT